MPSVCTDGMPTCRMAPILGLANKGDRSSGVAVISTTTTGTLRSKEKRKCICENEVRSRTTAHHLCMTATYLEACATCSISACCPPEKTMLLASWPSAAHVKSVPSPHAQRQLSTFSHNQNAHKQRHKRRTHNCEFVLRTHNQHNVICLLRHLHSRRNKAGIVCGHIRHTDAIQWCC